jgi:carboxymethylenebutenolidase
MGTTMKITTDDGSFDAYVATPDAPNGAAVVVIQEIFGVNAVMRGIADDLAAQGYVAVAPDLFWRIEPGVDITDKSPEEWQKAFDLYGKFNVDTGVSDIQATIDAIRPLAANGKVGAVGYCLGGLLAYLTATRTSADASVSYYGVGIDQKLDEADGLKAPLLMHVAEEDKFVSKEAQAAIAAKMATVPGVTAHFYPGLDHAFARVGGEHFDEPGATLANKRTAQFFSLMLG